MPERRVLDVVERGEATARLEAHVHEIDDETSVSEGQVESARVSIVDMPAPGDAEGPLTWDWTFDSVRDARVAHGLWMECGPFHEVGFDEFVPLAVAREGRPAMAAYLFLSAKSRAAVAATLDLDPATVTNYLSLIRSEPASGD